MPEKGRRKTALESGLTAIIERVKIDLTNCKTMTLYRVDQG
jgi:hypothetical protein